MIGDSGWIYRGQPFLGIDIGDNYAFVYIIRNMKTGRSYIGKKWMWSSRIKKIKGRKRKIRIRKMSDWMTYYGSSKELLADIEKIGKEHFFREILHLCKTKGDASYLEAKEQFENKVLESDAWYNSWIQIKCHQKHLSVNA